MNKLDNGVVFGPFIGEFGWEIMFWHGWVKKLCREKFRETPKYVICQRGRELLYPDADFILPIPTWFENLNTSGCGHITDGWKNGLPGLRMIDRRTKFANIRKYIQSGFKNEIPWHGLDISTFASMMLDEVKRKHGLSDDFHYFIPWQGGEFEGVHYGCPVVERYETQTFQQHRIRFEDQLFEKLSSKALTNIPSSVTEIDTNRGLISIFPRSRSMRRPSSNWPLNDYISLINYLNQQYSDFQIAMLGIPQGAYNDSRLFNGNIDLINIPSDEATSSHIIALENSALAIGSISGAMNLALLCGTPIVTWGSTAAYEDLQNTNIFRTPLEFIDNPRPTHYEVLKVIKKMIKTHG
ncbi:hypothetical protein OAM79_02555 [Litorivicinus sp.]|nr:hypothetical protein [Litorivicinus sp.]